MQYVLEISKGLECQKKQVQVLAGLQVHCSSRFTKSFIRRAKAWDGRDGTEEKTELGLGNVGAGREWGVVDFNKKDGAPQMFKSLESHPSKLDNQNPTFEASTPSLNCDTRVSQCPIHAHHPK